MTRARTYKYTRTDVLMYYLFTCLGISSGTLKIAGTSSIKTGDCFSTLNTQFTMDTIKSARRFPCGSTDKIHTRCIYIYINEN